ncbi:MAG: hypothetical protein DI539_16810 [Flavobacterium psychrophilum]|nr:MAG: hypothetical protein DI539_16810 [Flavobacterium psychrophilum]
MKNWFYQIKEYFTTINFSALFGHMAEVIWLTFFAFIPLIINITIAWIISKDISDAAKSKIIPGEILSYCLSFIAPSMYLFVKTNGTNYKLPLLKIFSIVTFTLYFLIALLLLIVKNKWVEGIDSEKHNFDLYFQLSIGFLIGTILLRIYSTYHGNYSNWSSTRKQQQEDFNMRISNRIG